MGVKCSSSPRLALTNPASYRQPREVMRICCFQPGATEIVYALGLQDQLYGVTSKCDYPPRGPGKAGGGA